MDNPPTRTSHLTRWRIPLFVGLPTLLSLAYFLIFAAPAFQSETRLIVRESKESTAPMIPGLGAGFLGMSGGSALEDAFILTEYLHSGELIDAIDAEMDLRGHFSAPRLDLLRRLPGDASQDDLHAYFRRMVRLTVATDSSIVSLQVRAFSPEFAQALARLLVTKSEGAINALNTRMTDATLAISESELERARLELTSLRQALLEFQVTNQLVDPASEVQLQLANLAAIDARLLEKEAQLAVQAQILREDSFELQVLRREIGALRDQRTEETARMISRNQGSGVAAINHFEALKLDAELALQKYTVALGTNESRKLEASRQQKFLVTIGSPTLPDEAFFPKPIRGTATAFLAILLFYGIGRLVIATVQDHTI